MKRKGVLIGGLVTILVLVSAAGLVYAQGGGPEGRLGPQGGGEPDPYTTFTYQGLLKRDGVPVDDYCAFRLNLYDASSGGNLIDTFNTSEWVTKGVFTIDVYGFAGDLNGEARWLEVAVKCSGDADYVALEPRQPLRPAPSAMALPGLRTSHNDTSPSVIGGYHGNTVADGVVGATIGGGGYNGNVNQVNANYGTVGGGANNTAGGVYAAVGGGVSNVADGMEATVAGGYNNQASGYAATVGGGISNQATATFATVPGGYGAVASHYGEMAYASGYFGSTAGNAQASLYVLRGLSNGSDWVYLYLDGSNQAITIADGRTVVFDILVVGRSSASDGNESAGYQMRGVAEKVGNTLNFWSEVYSLHEDDASWEAGVFANASEGSLDVGVKGNGETIRWVAVVRTAEVSW